MRSSSLRPASRPDAPTVAIVGRGRLGKTLHEALRAAGVPATLHAGRHGPSVAPDTDLVLLAVPDAAVDPAAARLAERLPAGRRPAVAHLSGALDVTELDAVAARGCPVGAFHPFLPFSEVRPPEVFHGATFGIEASTPELAERLVDLAERLGAHARLVDPAHRPIYHAAAVVASSYVVTLAAEAAGMLAVAGFSEEEGLTALLPLMRATLENLAADGLPGALSGPLRRADVAVVERHLDVIAADAGPQTYDVYRVLGVSALGLAERVDAAPLEHLRRRMVSAAGSTG